MHLQTNGALSRPAFPVTLESRPYSLNPGKMQR